MRRIFSELVPVAELARHPILGELGAREIQLLCAVQPQDTGDALRLVERARSIGLSIGLWPLVGDADGRWLSRANATQLEEHACLLVERARPDAIVLDLEPPISLVRRALRGDLRSILRSSVAQDGARVASIVRALGASAEIVVTVPPPVLPGRAGDGFARAFGIDALAPGEVTLCPMLYSSLFEGYARGAVRRSDAEALLGRWARAASGRWGDRACVALGCAGVGALGDERAWRGLSELERDVAIASYHVSDLALFDLAGVLARGEATRWLDAFCDPQFGAVPRTLRASLIDRTLRSIGRALPR